MDLKNIQWGEFFIEEIAEIYSGIDINDRDRKNGEIPFISASSVNNGIGDFINEKNSTLASNCISVNRTGSVGFAFFHTYEAVYSNNCRKLKVLNTENPYQIKFITSQISKQKEKYSYGYILGTERIKRQKILLPINSKGEPDYSFMEQYMRQKEKEKIDKFQNHITKRIEQVKNFNDVKPLNQIEWGEFYLKQVFTEIQRGKRLKKDNHKKGNIPYVSSSAMNNGIDAFVSNNERVRIFDNCLSIANSGSVGATFYQPFSFVASDHITKMKNENFNEFIYLFISSITKRLSEKYSFNREINDARIQKEKILLPINKKGEPDYEYMENYIKKLEYEKLTKYLRLKSQKASTIIPYKI